jgi:hypothetical protein
MAGGFRSFLPDDEGEQPHIDMSVAHIARVYDFWLGGKDNFAVDREVGQKVLDIYPPTVLSVRANRAFLARAVRYLAGQEGIRQFLDIGTGLPAVNNTHEVAQSVAPESRVAYVDNDPIVLAHARALLISGPKGATAYVDADARDTGKILTEAARLLDFSQPVAVMLVAILHLVSDDDAQRIVNRLMGAVPPGSFLVISDLSSDIEPEALAKSASLLNHAMAQRITPRSHAQVSRFFSSLQLVEPGLVPIQEWRPDTEAEAAVPAVMWGGVARRVLCRWHHGTPRGAARYVSRVCRPSSQIVQGRIAPIRRIPIGAHGSSPRRVSISRSSLACTTSMTSSPSPIGPPRTTSPPSTSPSMNAACSSQPRCSRRGRAAS